MSVLAGFDLVIELNSKIIENAIAATPFGSSTLSPPTEIVVGDKTNGVDATLLDPITFSLEVGSNGVTISIPFDETTVYFNGQTVAPLKGTLVLNGTISDFIKDSTNQLFDIGLFVSPADVSINWDPTPGSYTQNALGALSSSDRMSMESGMMADVSKEIGNNRPSAGMSFNEDSTKDGLLGKSGLRFRSVDEVQNIDAHTIGIFVTMLLSSVPPPSVVRTDPGLPGDFQATVSVSQGTFSQLIFCPAVTESLVSKFDPTTQTPDQFAAIVNSKMPSACGTADYVPISGGLKLTNIFATLESGFVQVGGTAILGKTDVYCFRLVADFNSHLIFSVKNGAIQTKLNPNPPNITSWVDVSWYCFLLYFLAAFVAFPITVLLVGWILLSVEWLALVLGPMMAPGLNLGSTEQVGLTGFTIQKVDTLPDRLTLTGTVQVAPPPPPGPGRSVVLAITDQQMTNETKIGIGTYHYPGSKYCKKGDYTYIESTDEEQVKLTATPHFMGPDPTFKWTVGGIPIVASSGDLTLGVGATIPQPGGFSLTLATQQTTVSYLLDDPTTLQLTGHGAFNYSLKVTVECDSDTGFVATDEQIVEFTNYTITMLDGYDQAMKNCGLVTRLAIDLLRTVPQVVPRGGDGPDYEQTVQILREAVLQGKAGATDGLIEGVRLYGTKLIDDMLAPSGGAAQA
jgi:hypothetical protein